MKANLACISLAAFVFASCDKSGKETNPAATSAKKPETRAHAPTIAETAAGRHESPGTRTGNTTAAAIKQPVNEAMIRPKGVTARDASWDTLAAEQKIEKFNSSGIARIPRYVSEKILSDAHSAGAPEDQVRFITEQAAAWNHIEIFKESVGDISAPMKMALLDQLFKEFGGSWKDMLPELNEQIAASALVMKFRMQGIPGMSPDESQDFIIDALAKYGPDYQTILSLANRRAKK